MRLMLSILRCVLLFLSIFVLTYCSAKIDNNPIQTNTSTIESVVSGDPGAVTNAILKASVMSTGKKWEINISWKSTDKTTQFDLKHGTTSKTYNDSYPNVTSPYILKDLEPGSSHFFVIVSSITVNNTVRSTTSEEFTIKIPLDSYVEKPGAFTMTAVGSDRQITLSWTDAERASSYVIQRGTKSGSYPVSVASFTKSPYIDKELTNGQTYYYIVIAVNSVGSTNALAEAFATPLGGPGPFGTLTLIPGNGTMTISWGSAQNVDHYIVERATSETGPFTVIQNPATSPFVDSTSSNGTTYFYRVIAVDINGVSSDPTAVSSATPSAAQGSFGTLTLIPGNASMTISWGSAQNIDHFIVERASSINGPFTVIQNPATSPFIDSSTSNGTTYYYRVTAVNSNGQSSDPTPVASATPLAPPGSLGTLTLLPGDASISISWSSVQNVDHYIIERATNQSGPFTVIENPAISPFIDLNASNGTTYYYRVTAVNSNGQSSDPSPVASSVPVPVPGSYTVTSQAGDGQVTLTWPAATNAVTYTVRYGTNTGSYPTTVSSAATSPTIVNGLSNGTTYYFQVIAVNPSGSTNSNEVSSTPNAASPHPWAGTRLIGGSAGNQEWWSGGVLGTIGQTIGRDSSGNIFVGGHTDEYVLDGQSTIADWRDGYVTKYNNAGIKQWTRRIGGNGGGAWGWPGDTWVHAIACDSQGNVYVGGGDSANIQTSDPKLNDIVYFLSKFDSSGNLLWTHIGGTPNMPSDIRSITIDSNDNVYITGVGQVNGFANESGHWGDFYIAKYTSSGSIVWVKNINTAGDFGAWGLTADSANSIYLTGAATSSVNSQTMNGIIDGVVIKFDNDGNTQWTRQFGLANKNTTATAGVISSDNYIYVTGYTDGDLDGQTLTGTKDAFVAKYDSSGTRQWTRLLGVPGVETFSAWNKGISIDSSNNLYIVGYTFGSLDGQTLTTAQAGFLTKYDPAGSRQWTRLLQSNSSVIPGGVIVDPFDGIFFAGSTNSDVDGEAYIGGSPSNAFLSKFDSSGVLQSSVPAPGSFTVTSQAGDGQVTLTWPAATNAVTYTVRYGTNTGSYPTTVSSAATSPTIVNGLSNGTTYYFQVIAVNPSGSTNSNEVSGTPNVAHPWAGTRLIGGSAGNQEWWSGGVLGTHGQSIARDSSGNIFVTGRTDENVLDGQTPSSDWRDIYITMYNNAGVKQWTRRLGGYGGGAWGWPGETYVLAIVCDSQGNVYVAGETSSNIQSSDPKLNDIVYFLSKFDNSGNLQWTHIGGHPTVATCVRSITIDSNDNIYIAGDGQIDGFANASSSWGDFFIAKYTSSGSRVWVKNVNTSVGFFVGGLSMDTTNSLYLTGVASSSINGQSMVGTTDGVIIKYDSDGNTQWTSQFGLANKNTTATAGVISSDNYIYVTGYTDGDLDGQTLTGTKDTFVAKYDSSGTRQWTELLGVAGVDTVSAWSRGISVDSSDNLYVAGYTLGSLDGQTLTTGQAGFLAKYNPAGSRQWTRLLQSNSSVSAGGVTVDPFDGIFFIGDTNSGIDGQAYIGGSPSNAFLSKFNSSGVLQSGQ